MRTHELCRPVPRGVRSVGVRVLVVGLAVWAAGGAASARSAVGNISGPFVLMPKNERAGLLLHRPNLEALALTPADLGTGNITYQGYQPDTALRPVSEYERDMTPAGSLASLQEVVLLFRSPAQASGELDRLGDALDSRQGWRRLGSLVNGVSALSDRASILVHVGSGSRALIGTASLPGGRRFSLGFICLRVGSTVEFVTFATSFGVFLPTAAFVQLVDVAAARAERGLHKSALSTTLPVA